MATKKAILLIEDNTMILENLTEYLQLEGYAILNTNNGASGIQLAIEYVPDLIICDALMAQMSGFQVLGILMHTARTFEIPFIFSTSMSEKTDSLQAFALGADGSIVKPFAPEDLLAMAEKCLELGGKRHKLRV